MRISNLATTSLLAALLTIPVGCSAAHETTSTTDSEEAISASAATTLPPPADPNARLYFASPAYDAHSSANYLSYRVFSAQGGHEFKVGAAVLGSDGNIDPARGIGFKLAYLARYHGKLAWLPVRDVPKSIDGVNGVATLKYTAPVSRTYMMEVSAGFDVDTAVEVRSDLECAGGDARACELPGAGQPGEMCGGIAAGHFTCDTGLFCQLADGVCASTADAAGTCQAKPQMCPMIFMPICGCDGKTYGNGCNAHHAGISVAHVGACVSR